jgi:hypothetical protein
MNVIKKRRKILTLQRETLRTLQSDEMADAFGGQRGPGFSLPPSFIQYLCRTQDPSCPPTCPPTCRETCRCY